MTTIPEPPAPARPGRAGVDLVAAVLVAAGVTQVVPGVLAFAAPGAFYDLLASYPPENDHFIRDLGTWQIALGAAALYAARRPAWRVPMLGVLALQYGLHTVSHVIDLGDADPAWHGTSGLVVHLVAVLAVGGLFLRERAR